MNDTSTLRALGIVLRPLALSDAAALFAALGDPVVQLYRRAPAHTDVSETRAYIEKTLQRSRAAWAITDDGGEALGRLALRVQADCGEFGIVIRRAAHGRGLGRKAIGLAEAYAFDKLGLARLCADIDYENEASLALFRAAGFAEETLLPAHRTTKLGIRDSIILAKPRPAR